MNNKEVVKEIRNILQAYYFVDVLSADCSIDSLIRIDEIGTGVHTCRECTVADTINVVRKEGDVMCPMIMEEEVKVLR